MDGQRMAAHGVSSEIRKPLRSERFTMRRYCRNVDITDIEFIKRCVWKWIKDKKNRRDVQRFLAQYSAYYSYKQIQLMMYVQDYRCLDEIIDSIACDVQKRIIERDLQIPPLVFRMSYDTGSRKWRKIGIQKPIHQIFDYIAVEACMEMFMAKIGPYQMASITGRGQEAGTKAILKWLQTDPEGTRWYGKGDIRKCYPSIPHDRIKAMFARDIKNPVLLWLIFELIDAFPEGLSIGSFFSQYACNYYLSKLYHYMAEQLYKERRRRGGPVVRVRLIYHQLFYMDDIFITGSSEKDVNSGMKKACKFAHDELGLEIKADWFVAQTDYIDKNGKHRGRFIDMMGRRIYRDHVTVRRRTFKKIRRTFIRAQVCIESGKPMKLEQARRVVSYGGNFKHTDSCRADLKYRAGKIRTKAKKVVAANDRLLEEKRREIRNDYYGSNLAEQARCNAVQFEERQKRGSMAEKEYQADYDGDRCPF